MTVTLGADPNFVDSTFPNLGQEEQLASNDNGAWAFAYTDVATKTVKVNTSGGAVLTLGSNVVGIPEVDTSADGKLVVAWGEQFIVKNADNYAVKAAVMDFPTGSTAPAVWNLTFVSAKGSTPDITGITIGGVNAVASYRYFPPRATTNTAVIQRVSLASGAASTAVTAAHAMSLETNPVDNGYVAVWHDSQANGNVYAQRYDKNGAKLGGQVAVAATTAHEMHGNVDVDAAGNYVVSLSVKNADGSLTAAAQQVSAGGVVSPTRVDFDSGYAKTTTPDEFGNLYERRVNSAPNIDVKPDGTFLAQWSFVQTTYPSAGGYSAESHVVAQQVNAGGDREAAFSITSTSASGPADSSEYHAMSKEIVYLGDTDGDGIDNILGTYGIRQENSSTNGFGVRYGETLNLPASL